MRMKKNGSHRRQDEWQALIAGHKTGVDSVRGYCRNHGINEKTFYNWRKKLSKRPEINSEQFIQIKATEKGTGKVLRIQTPSGYRLEFESGTKESYARSILEILAVLK